MPSTVDNLVYVEEHELKNFAQEILIKHDVPVKDASIVAECLVSANLRGVDSHGVIRLPVYVSRLHKKIVKAKPEIKVEHRTKVCLHINGDNGLGPVVGQRAMQEALKLAKLYGMGLSGVSHSNHFGPASFYVDQAVAAGCIGIACSNAPPNMAPWGGRTRFLGTNPLGVGIPCGTEPPIIFDMATSVVARGKIIMAAQRGEPIPEGWAVDPQGLPTTDPVQALLGAVLPFGGAKGSAISFLIDALAGAWTGANYGRYINTLENYEKEQSLGHLFLALRADLFMPMSDFTSRIDDLVHMLKTTPPAAGVASVMAPGDPELMIARERKLHGIPITSEVWKQLSELAKATNVTLPVCNIRRERYDE